MFASEALYQAIMKHVVSPLFATAGLLPLQ